MNKTKRILKIDKLNAVYGKHHALIDISLSLPMGAITGIVGPNGAGKSTLIKTLSQIKSPTSGSILIDDTPISHFKDQIAYVPQKKEMNLDFPILVEEVVALGAIAKKKWYQRLTKHDREKARNLLKQLDLDSIAKKGMSELSGGQQQRVLLARALMQDASILLLDEPFVGLDIVSEDKLMSELKKLALSGISIFIVHHDLHSWKKYFDQLILLKTKLIAAGSFNEVFTSENLMSAYGINLNDLS
jgi:manganese transport system ATP-binding protein